MSGKLTKRLAQLLHRIADALAGRMDVPHAPPLDPELSRALRELDALRPYMTTRAYYRVLRLVYRGFSPSRSRLPPQNSRGD